MSQRIVRFAELRWSRSGLLDSGLLGCGAQLAAVIGLGMAEDRDLLAPVSNAHGLSIEWLKIPRGGRVSRHRLKEKQVLIAKNGAIEVEVGTSAGPISHVLHGSATAWDTFALPADCWRTFRNTGDGEALAIVMSAGDQRKRIEWSDAVVQAAAASDLAIDASGYVARKGIVERAQR